jgi:N-succinyldiaminopimelate aminotransferase
MSALPGPGQFPGAARVRALQPMGLVEILLLARQHGAIDLATGSPSFPETPGDLLEHACAALRSGLNQYDDPAGNRDLRVAAAKIHGADPDTEITITAGSTGGLNVVLQSLVQPGDEVVVIEPYYEGYPAAIHLAGAVPRFVRLHEPGWEWRPAELAAAFGPRTRAVIVNSPHNPTGRVLTAAELAEIGALCATWDATLISDEVYTEFVDDPDSVALPGDLPGDLPGAAGRVVVLRSLSKSHAVGGWRIGWIYAAPPLTRIFRVVHETLTAGVVAPLQVAAAEIVREQPGWTARQRGQLAENRSQLVSMLGSAGMRCDLPQGSAFLLARMPEHADGDADAFVRRLIAEVGVAAAPGAFFFDRADEGARWLRFGYNKAEPVLAEAASRLKQLSA